MAPEKTDESLRPVIFPAFVMFYFNLTPKSYPHQTVGRTEPGGWPDNRGPDLCLSVLSLGMSSWKMAMTNEDVRVGRQREKIDWGF